MAYGESNGDVIDDVTRLWKVKVMTPVSLAFNILKTGGDAGM